MHYELNRKTLKILANEPTRTLLEKQLIDLCLRLYDQVGRSEENSNELKQTLCHIQCYILNKTPWILESARKCMETGKASGPNAVHVAVVGVAPSEEA